MIIKGKHHHWTVGANGAICLKGIKERLLTFKFLKVSTPLNDIIVERERLLRLKVLKAPTPLNAIIVERECDPIINVQCNGLVLCEVLVDEGIRVNVMTIPTMKYLMLRIGRPTSITLKMANKRFVKP